MKSIKLFPVNSNANKHYILTLVIACFVWLLSGIGTELTAQVSGVVFRDYNGNGTKDNTATYNEGGVSGITVTAYNSAGTNIGSAVTIANGTYSIAALSGAVRIEFTGLSASDFSGPNGSGSGTSVQFITAPASNVNLGVNYPDDYWNNSTQPVPQLVVPRYINGAATNPAAATYGGILQIGNDQSGISGLTINEVAKASEVGTVWGEAFNKYKNRYFFSTMLKRSAGLGPEGMGGIYMAEPNGSGIYDIVGSFTLQGIVPSNSATALDFGAVTRVTSPATADNYLAVSYATEPSRDLDAFAKAGTMAYGDIDMDEANQKLYMTNLFQNRIIVMDVSGSTTTLDNATSATLGSLITAYNVASLPGAPTCTSGNLRIWALKIYKGRGYLGVVCDAMSSQSQGNLAGYILSFDVSNITAGFTTELTWGASYRNPTFWQNWRPWVNAWAQTAGSGASNSYYYYQQPVISDIEFNENGDMTIAIMDRFGNQMGASNYKPESGSTVLINGVAFGDILQARKNGSGVWVFEGTAGTIPPNHTATENNDCGYGNITGTQGEYINDRSGDGSPEGAMGSMAKLMGTGVVVATNVDPYPVSDNSHSPYYDTGGFHWYNVTDGTWSQHARVYGQQYGIDFGKAVGLGDVEANVGIAPLEIGNRIWNDTDSDGIQDAGESGINNVTVELYADFDNNGMADGPVLATTTTANGGQWYFNPSNVTDGDPGVTGNQAGPQPQKRYLIRIGSADWTGGAGTGDLAGFNLTTANVGGAGQPDVRDNDATLSATIPTISYQTGKWGENDHTLDIGFIATCSLTSAGETFETCNNNGTPSNGADDYITFSLNPTGSNLGATYSVTASGGATVTLAAGGAATGIAYGSAKAFRLQNGSANGTLYTITVTDVSGAPCTATTTVQQSACITTTCDCKEYIYLNEPFLGAVLKFEIGGPVTLTEIQAPAGGHWYPGTAASQLPSPHGIATDLNGRLYIGEDYNPPAKLRRFDCEGNIEPVSPTTVINTTNYTFNMFSIDNTIYTSRTGGPAAFNSCTGALIGTMCFNDANGVPVPYTGDHFWGLSYNATTQKVYATGRDGVRRAVYAFTKAQLEAGIAGGPCINPLITMGTSATVNPGDNFIPTSMVQLLGIISDNTGNIYVVGNDAAGFGIILKYNAAGQFIAMTSPIPQAIATHGIVWSETYNRLFIANYTDDPAVDCISAFDAASMTYIGTAAANPNLPTNNTAKALGIVKECCPASPNTTVQQTLCNVNVGDKLYLNQIANSGCNGILCGNTWTPSPTNVGFTFDACDNSIVVLQPGACGTFTAAGNSARCGAFTTTLNLCTTPSLTSPSGPQSFCAGSTGANITVQTTTNTANSVRFVRFTTDQMAGATPTAGEAAAIYAGTAVATVTPTGGSSPYTATLTSAAAGWSTLPAGIYYVYAIVNPDPGATCRPVQEIVVTINATPNLPAGPLSVTNVCPATTADLTTITATDANATTGTISYHSTLAGASNPANNTTDVVPSPATVTVPGTYYIRKTTSAGCFDYVEVSATATSCCVPPVLTVQNGGLCAGTSIVLTTLVTGNTPAGVLTFHLSQSDANAGVNALGSTTVAPAVTTTYYVRSTNGAASCYSTASVTVTVVTPPVLTVMNAQICAGSSIDLATLVTGTGGGALSYHTTWNDANNDTNPLASSTVTPASAANYFIRSEVNQSGVTCYDVEQVTVTFKAVNCGTIGVSGSN